MNTTHISTAVDTAVHTLVPQVDVFEDSTGVTLLADVPGVRKEGLDIRVDGSNLSLEGQVFDEAMPSGDTVFAELRASRYRRVFALSDRLDTGAIDAQLKDGVLRVRIPKLPDAQPRRIEVRVG